MLADTFTKPDTQSVVICCLSPTPTDTEHIISTLTTGCKICGLEQFISEAKLPVSLNLPKRPDRPHPQKWSGDKTAAWLQKVYAAITGVDAGDAGKQAQKAFLEQLDLLPPSFCGKGLCRWSRQQFSLLCQGDKNAEPIGVQMFNALRAEMKEVERIKKQKTTDRRDVEQRSKHW